MKTNKWRAKTAAIVSLFLAGLPLAADLRAGEPAAAGKPGAQRLVKDLTRDADFVFRGTVQRTGAANLSIVEPGPTTAVVRVDEILKAGDTLDDFTGRDITVFVEDELKAGEQRVFFTSVRLLGESLGAQEVGRGAGPAADLAQQVRSAKGELLRDDLASRLAAADLVVSGRVISTRATYSLPKTGPVTEHDPLWWEATLEVSSVLKGTVGERTVTFWYPSSRDVMWAFAPKPSAGQQGTWLLHRHTPESGAAVFAATEPRDLLSAAEAKTAEGMVKP